MRSPERSGQMPAAGSGPRSRRRSRRNRGEASGAVGFRSHAPGLLTGRRPVTPSSPDLRYVEHMIAPLLALLAAAAANQTGGAVATKPPLPVLQESQAQYEPPQMPDWYSVHHVRRPVAISRVEPECTPEARERKAQGAVIVGLWVNTNGRPCRLRVLRSLEPGLDAKALEAAPQWRFKPALKRGKPVPAPVTIEFGFRLL